MRYQHSLTVARGDEKVMSESGHRTDHGRVQDLILLILVMEVALQKLIDCEIGSVSGDASARYHLSAFPKTEQTLLLIKYTCCFEEGQL